MKDQENKVHCRRASSPSETVGDRTEPVSGLIFDWNELSSPSPRPNRIEFDDETLRDGLQSPSVRDPRVRDKIEILHLMERIGVDTADIGLPGAGPRAAEHTVRLAREIRDSGLSIRPNCAARSVVSDVEAVVDASQRAGISIEAYIFIGSSPIRVLVEGWDEKEMLDLTREAVGVAVRNGLPVTFVTEDTTRAHPDSLARLYSAALHAGAGRVCVCDTVGHSTPEGARHVVSWMKDWLGGQGFDQVGIDWHGHMDRGLGIWNTVAAIFAGADRVHGTALGVGERVGNTPLDLLLVNLNLMGWLERDLRPLPDYCLKVAEVFGIAIPPQYPVFGSDAFETATGIHAAAISKAMAQDNGWLADRVYSGVPASDFGLTQRIRVGPLSGKSNVVSWLRQNHLVATEELVRFLLEFAKQSDRLLTDEELSCAVDGFPDHR